MKFTRNSFLAAKLLLFVTVLTAGCDQSLKVAAQDGVQTSNQPNRSTVATVTSAAVQKLLQRKREDSLGVEDITDTDLEIDQIDRWIREATADAKLDSPRSTRAFSLEDFNTIRRGITTRRELLFHAFVDNSLTSKERDLIRTDAPELLASIQQADTALKEHSSSSAGLQSRIEKLSEQAKTDPEIAKLMIHAENTADSFSHDDFVKQSQAKMQRASQNATSADELIELQVGGLSDALDQMSEAVATESKKRWSLANLQIHRFVWARLSSEEQASIGACHYDYVKNVQKQLGLVRKHDSDPQFSQPAAPTVPTVEEVGNMIVRMINAKVDEHNATLRVAHEMATRGYASSDDSVYARVVATKAELDSTVKTHGAALAPALAELCFNPTDEIGREALSRLKSIGKPAIEMLSKPTGDKERDVMHQFGMAKAFASRAPDIDEDLLWRTANSESQFRELAFEELSDRKKLTLNEERIQCLIIGLNSRTTDLVRMCLNIVAGESIEAPEVADAIERIAKSRNRNSRQAEILLSRFEGRSAPLASRLISELVEMKSQSTGWDDERKDLISRISQFEPDGSLLSPLAAYFEDNDQSAGLMRDLAKLFASSDDAAVAAVVERLKRSSPGTDRRIALIDAVRMIGVYSKSSASLLMQIIQTGSQKEKKAAVKAIASFGTSAKDHVPALLAQLSNRKMANDVGNALRRIVSDPDEVTLRSLLPYLQSRDGDIVYTAAEIIRDAGPQAKVILPEIITISHSQKFDTRGTAASILGTIGVATPEVIQRLSAIALDRGGFSARKAIQSLGSMGDSAKAAIPTLTKVVAESRGGKERYEAIWSLILIDEPSPEIVPALKQLYEKGGPSGNTRYSSVALIHFGEPVENYRRDLHYLLENRGDEFRRQFQELGAKQMLDIDPENRLALAVMERQERNTRFEAAKLAAEQSR